MNRFILSEDEKERILNLHESATKRHYLSEQIVTNYDKTYDYKKEGEEYFYKLKNANDWTKASGTGLDAIKTQVYNKPSVSSPKSSVPSSNPSVPSSNPIPFKTKEEGDKFRVWMNKSYPNTSKNLKLDPTGPFDNSNIKNAWNHKGTGGIKGDLYTKQVLSKGGGESSSKTESGGLVESPFTTKKHGIEYREWLNTTLPNIAKKYVVSSPSKLSEKFKNTEAFYNNKNILNSLNQTVTWGSGDKKGQKISVWEYYQFKNRDWDKKTYKEKIETGNIFVSDTINPAFSSKIDFSDLSTSNSTENICEPGTKHCATFVNKFTDKFDSIGNAWDAYRYDIILGPTINSKFKGLDKSQIKKAIDLWLKIHKNGGGKENGDYMNEVKSFVNQLVPSKGSEVKLEIDDIVGIFHPGSSHHEESFYHGGKKWFNDKDGKMVPGNSIQRGEGWGMNTHVGIVGAIKDGVPLIFHNVGGNVISDPASNLRIAWVKRKGGSKPVKV